MRFLLRPLRALRQPLWDRNAGQPDVELCGPDAPARAPAAGGTFQAAQATAPAEDHPLGAGAGGPGGLVEARLVRAGWLEHLKGAAFAAVALALMGLVLMGLIDCLFTSSGQRSWVVLGGLFYIGAIWKQALEHLRLIFGNTHYLRVVVSRMEALMLWEAVVSRLEAMAETRGPDFTSRDVEAFTKYDTAAGKREVKLSFFGTRPKQFSFYLNPAVGQDGALSLQARRNPMVTVEYHSGESVVMGRDSHLEQKRVMVLWIKTTPEFVVQDKALLRRWFDECVGEHLEPPPDRVEVYGLQESSSDWVPEWQLERTKSIKSAGRAGDSFYLERQVFNELIADARIWAKRTLRLYMVTGPPGVGKTEFTVWLAGCLRLPIYRLSLTMDSLTDARLAQLLAQNMMKHETAVLQIDEFQEVLRRWDTNGTGIAVTPGGFCEVLQGSTTVAKGVIVLTGTGEVTNHAHLRAYPALFRRFQIKIRLGYLELGDMARFFKSFLQEFVDLSEDEWQVWQSTFATCLSQHGPKQVSIDMVKQLLMRRITAACAEGFLVASPGTAGYRVVECHKSAFASRIFCEAAMKAFFQAYASDDGGADPPGPGCANDAAAAEAKSNTLALAS